MFEPPFGTPFDDHAARYQRRLERAALDQEHRRRVLERLERAQQCQQMYGPYHRTPGKQPGGPAHRMKPSRRDIRRFLELDLTYAFDLKRFREAELDWQRRRDRYQKDLAVWSAESGRLLRLRRMAVVIAAVGLMLGLSLLHRIFALYDGRATTADGGLAVLALLLTVVAICAVTTAARCYRKGRRLQRPQWTGGNKPSLYSLN